MKFHSQIKKLPAEGRQCSEYCPNIRYYKYSSVLDTDFNIGQFLFHDVSVKKAKLHLTFRLNFRDNGFDDDKRYDTRERVLNVELKRDWIYRTKIKNRNCVRRKLNGNRKWIFHPEAQCLLASEMLHIWNLTKIQIACRSPNKVSFDWFFSGASEITNVFNPIWVIQPQFWILEWLFI